MGMNHRYRTGTVRERHIRISTRIYSYGLYQPAAMISYSNDYALFTVPTAFLTPDPDQVSDASVLN